MKAVRLKLWLSEYLQVPLSWLASETLKQKPEKLVMKLKTQRVWGNKLCLFVQLRNNLLCKCNPGSIIVQVYMVKNEPTLTFMNFHHFCINIKSTEENCCPDPRCNKKPLQNKAVRFGSTSKPVQIRASCWGATTVTTYYQKHDIVYRGMVCLMVDGRK